MNDLYAIAMRLREHGLAEIPGAKSHPLILGMLRLDQAWPEDDSVSWCSAFVNFVAFIAGYERTKHLAARSWLGIGTAVDLPAAEPGDVVILTRAGAPSTPHRGPDGNYFPGHVAFFSALTGGRLHLLGGNQGDRVSISDFEPANVLGVRRLAKIG